MAGFTRSDVDALCASLPGATLAHPPELISWKVGGKMFACIGQQDGSDGVSVKCRDAETASMLIEAGIGIRAKYFHASWIRLPYDMTPADAFRDRILISYDLARASLKKAERDALPKREDI